ncbi:SAP30-binding protein-like, partial [Homarus americanus]
MGTNYPLDMYDPHCWGKESYYDELARVQKEEMDKREKERKDKTKVNFKNIESNILENLCRTFGSIQEHGALGIPIGNAYT